MKLIRVKKKDLEDGNALSSLYDLSDSLPLTALKVEKNFELNFYARKVSSIEEELNSMEFKANRLVDQLKQIRKIFNARKKEALNLQKKVQNKVILS